MESGAPGRWVVPPQFRPTEEKLRIEVGELGGGGIVVRALKKRKRGAEASATVEVRPGGVTVVSAAVADGRSEWPVERILEVRGGGQGAVCLLVRESGEGGERWRRVRLPVFPTEKNQDMGAQRLINLAGPWVAGEIGRVLGRPKLVDAYVAGPGWVDAQVEEAGRRGQLVYGLSAPGQHAERPPEVERGERLEVRPRAVGWQGHVVFAAMLGAMWLFGVGVCAGVIGRAAVIPAGIFGALVLGMGLFTVVGSILDARQHVVISAAEPGVVEVDVRRFPRRRRRRRLTRENTRAVYVEPGGRTPNLMVSRGKGKDRVLLRGVDREVVRSAVVLIERQLGLEPTEVATAAAGPVVAEAVVPVGPPEGDCPEKWEVRDEGQGTWVVTRPAARAWEKVQTVGYVVAVAAGAVVAARMFPGHGPVPGVGGVIVAALGLVVLSGRIERALGPAVVRYDGEAVHIARRGVFGRVRKRIDAWAIERVVIGGVVVMEGKRPTASVELRLRDGTRHGVIGVGSERGIRWLARKLASSLNMTEDVSEEAVVGGMEG